MTLARHCGALVASLLCLFAGCASRPSDDGAPWTSGRLSVRVDATTERSASSTSASFELRGNGDRGELRLSTPIGTLLASARWAADGVVLATGSAESRYDDLDSLSRDALGEVLPLRAFPDWLAGRPWPGAPSQARGDGFDQLGWRVSLARFADGWVEATRETPPTVLVRVRLERPA